MSFTIDYRGLIINDCDKKLRQYPKRYPIPRFHTRYPFKRNPIDITHEHQLREWVDYLYPSSQIPANKFSKLETTTLVVAFFYPLNTSVDRYADIIKLFVAFFILDDHTECGWGDVGRDVDQCRLVWTQFKTMFDELGAPGDIQMNEWKSYVVGMYPVYKRVYFAYNKQQRERYVEVWKEYADGNVEETEALRNGMVFTSVEQQLKIRMKSIGVRPSIQLFEYAYDFYLPESDWVDPRLQALIYVCSESVIYVNDIYSFEKEVLEESGDLDRMFNTVALIARLDGCSVLEAMDAIVGRIARNEERMYRMAKDIILGGQGCSHEMSKFIGALFYFYSAQHKCSTTWDRYHKFNKV